MSENKTDKLFAAQLHYGALAQSLEVPSFWRQYIAQLACELFGEAYAQGEIFLREASLRTEDPLRVLRKQTDNNELGALARRVWDAQCKICLPLIEKERCSYINIQHGRLLSVLGAEYWDEEIEDYRMLLNPETGEAAEDPYDLDIATLRKLGYLTKRLVMLGTYSTTPFYNMYEEEKLRFGFLADLWDRITHFKLCIPEELEKLFDGHEKFLLKLS